MWTAGKMGQRENKQSHPSSGYTWSGWAEGPSGILREDEKAGSSGPSSSRTKLTLLTAAATGSCATESDAAGAGG